MSKQCQMCFKSTDNLRPAEKNCPANVCKACGYKIDQVTGFLRYYGGQFQFQPDLFETPPTPPQRKRTTKASRKDKRGPKEVEPS
jgi:hypothetical protein